MSTNNRERRVQFELRPAVYQALCRELAARGESIEDRGAIGRLINDILTTRIMAASAAGATPIVPPGGVVPVAYTAQAQDDDSEWGFAKDKV